MPMRALRLAAILPAISHIGQHKGILLRSIIHLVGPHKCIVIMVQKAGPSETVSWQLWAITSPWALI